MPRTLPTRLSCFLVDSQISPSRSGSNQMSLLNRCPLVETLFLWFRMKRSERMEDAAKSTGRRGSLSSLFTDLPERISQPASIDIQFKCKYRALRLEACHGMMRYWSLQP